MEDTTVPSQEATIPADAQQVVENVETQESAPEEEVRDKDHITRRIREMEKTIKELKDSKPEKTEVKPEPKEPEPGAGPDLLTREEAKLMENGYSLAEVDFIKSFAKASGMPPTEAVADAGLQAAIKAKRDKAASEAATPEPSQRSKSVKSKSLSDMSEAERRKHFSPDAWKARKERANG